MLLILAALRHRKSVPKRDRPDVPVPVMFTLSGWDPNARRAQDWLAGRLRETYPLFAGRQGVETVRGLLAEGKIAVILDGLDPTCDMLRGTERAQLADQQACRSWRADSRTNRLPREGPCRIRADGEDGVGRGP